MAKGTKNEAVLFRTVKWEVRLDAGQEKLLVRVSDGLREIYNWGRGAWMAAYAAYREEKKAGIAKPTTKLPSFYDQVNLLTELGVADRGAELSRATIPRNWKEETLDSLHGALSSYFSLVKKGDPDARLPREHSANRFSAISGRFGFAIKNGRVVLAPNIFGKEALTFPIPEAYQAAMLARAARLKKFVIFRDEPDLGKPGRYWISVSYELPKPEAKPFVPKEAVFIALGASSIGIVSPKGEAVIELWRSDKFWVPKVQSVKALLIRKGSGTNFHPVKKGSRRHRRLLKSRAKMFALMGKQQTQNRREVVAALIEKTVENVIRGHGVHFVVSELVVRSKEGKLADAQKPKRSGPLGLNWSAQNTGSIGYLAQWLSEKAPEYGGSVRRHKLSREAIPPGLPKGRENKVLVARALRDDFLKSLRS